LKFSCYLLREYSASIDEIETATGLEFLSALTSMALEQTELNRAQVDWQGIPVKYMYDYNKTCPNYVCTNGFALRWRNFLWR
jgi:hypothetical protein